MKHNRTLPAVLVLAVVALAGCSRAVNTTFADQISAPARDTPFCQKIIVYRAATNLLNGDTLTANLPQAKQLLQTAHDDEADLATVAPPDQKNNVSTIEAAFGQLSQQLDSLRTADPQVVVNALLATKQDKTVTAAASALNTYTSASCGLNPYQVPPKGAVTTLPTTTTVVGPSASPVTTG
jgi:hypothetical protein